MKLAQRVSHLGTETAFAVSAEAAAMAARGRKVYPFHLGDLNLPTPSVVIEAAFKAIKDGKTGYCPNAGIMPLREALAEDVGAARGVKYGPENVAVQPGGKPTIGKFIRVVMDPGDEVLYPNPGFPIYGSMIEFYGGRAVPYTYHEGAETFELDFESIAKQVTPRTRLLILNDLQNPTGAECSLAEMEALAELARKHDLYVLSDEAYFDVRYQGRSRSITALPGMAERTVILYTFSKKFAMTGWRLGAAIGPREIIEVITRLNVNEESCSNHFVQYGALAGLKSDQAECRKILETLQERRDAAVDILNSIPGVRCLKPNATFYLYPNVTQAMENKGLPEYDAFRKTVLEKTGVSFCTRRHFGRPLPGETQKYLRLAYSGINLAEIKESLSGLKDFLEN